MNGCFFPFFAVPDPDVLEQASRGLSLVRPADVGLLVRVPDPAGKVHLEKQAHHDEEAEEDAQRTTGFRHFGCQGQKGKRKRSNVV